MIQFLFLKTIITVNILKYQIEDENNHLITFKEGLDLFQTNENFVNNFINELKSIEMKAFYWECSPLTLDNLNKPFEFMIIKAKLYDKPDFTSFKQYFENCGKDSITSFLNVNGDATLIVPCPIYVNSNYLNYVHLAEFIRNAPTQQIHSLFKRIGRKTLGHLQRNPANKKIWLSTAGGGVPWLHIRLDSIPKYIHWQPYTESTSPSTIQNENQYLL